MKWFTIRMETELAAGNDTLTPVGGTHGPVLPDLEGT